MKNLLTEIKDLEQRLVFATSLAEFKRMLQPGTKWHAYHHGGGSMAPKDMGVREVSKLQSNAVAFKMENGKESWLQFPKAKEMKFENDSFIILEDGKPLLTYKKAAVSKDVERIVDFIFASPRAKHLSAEQIAKIAQGEQPWIKYEEALEYAKELKAGKTRSGKPVFENAEHKSILKTLRSNSQK